MPRVTEETEFHQYTPFGCYTIIYYTSDAELCADCAKEHFEEEEGALSYDVYWEGESRSCDGCGFELEPSYPEE